MNAISDLSLVSPAEFSLSGITSDASAMDAAAGFHERMQTALNRIAALRRKIANAQSILPRVDFTTPSTEEIEAAILHFEEREQAAKHYRRIAAQEVKTMRRSLARLHRNHLRPIVSRVAFAADTALLEQLRLLQEGRMRALAELASRPQVRDSGIMSSRDDVRSHFARLLAA